MAAVADVEEEAGDGEEFIEVQEPQSLMMPAGDGAVAIPDLDVLAEALGAVPLAFQTDGQGGLFWLSPDLKWLPVERKSGKADVKRIQ